MGREADEMRNVHSRQSRTGTMMVVVGSCLLAMLAVVLAAGLDMGVCLALAAVAHWMFPRIVLRGAFVALFIVSIAATWMVSGAHQGK